MLAETRAELDDFHASSKELEEELERELERTEKAQQELKVKVAKADAERDEWKVFLKHSSFFGMKSFLSTVQIHVPSNYPQYYHHLSTTRTG
jgi:hypothetical protein